jgi:GNAT superfamily N-acetyltransferase
LLVAQCISSRLCFVDHAAALALKAGVASLAPQLPKPCWPNLLLFDSWSTSVQVNPAWQRSGLGRGLVERLTARLVNEDITIVSLYAEPNVVGLYNRLGFVANPDGIKGMAFQKTSKPGKALVEQAAATAAVAA